MVPAVIAPGRPAPWPLAEAQEGLFVPTVLPLSSSSSALAQIPRADSGSPTPGSGCWVGPPPQLPGGCIASPGAKGIAGGFCSVPGMVFLYLDFLGPRREPADGGQNQPLPTIFWPSRGSVREVGVVAIVSAEL